MDIAVEKTTININDNVYKKRNNTLWDFSAVILNVIVDIGVCYYYNALSIVIVDIISMILIMLYARKINNVPFGLMILIKTLAIGYAVIQCNGYTAMYGNLYYIGGSDDLLFEQNAIEMINKKMIWPWEFQHIYPSSNYSGFVSFLALIMRITNAFGGYHTFAYIVCNINIWLLTSLMVLKYLNLHDGIKKTHAICAVLLFIFPNAVYITAHVFRDTLCACLLFLGYSIIDTKNTAKLKCVPLTLIMVIAYYVRRESALLILCMVLFSVVDTKVSGLKKLIYLMLIIVMVFTFAYMFGIFDYSLDKYARYVVYTTSTQNEIINYIYGMPIIPFGGLARCLYGLVSPLPTGLLEFPSMFENYYSFRDVFISIGMIGQILCLPFLFKRLTKADYMALSFLVIFLSNRLVTAGFRHIILAYPLMFIMIYEQLSHTNKRLKNHIFTMAVIGLCVLAVIYITVF